MLRHNLSSELASVDYEIEWKIQDTIAYEFEDLLFSVLHVIPDEPSFFRP